MLFKLIAKRPIPMPDGSVRGIGEDVGEIVEWNTFEYLLGLGRIAFEVMEDTEFQAARPRLSKLPLRRTRKNEVHV